MSDKPWAGRFNLPTDKFVEEFNADLTCLQINLLKNLMHQSILIKDFISLILKEA